MTTLLVVACVGTTGCGGKSVNCTSVGKFAAINRRMMAVDRRLAGIPTQVQNATYVRFAPIYAHATYEYDTLISETGVEGNRIGWPQAFTDLLNALIPRRDMSRYRASVMASARDPLKYVFDSERVSSLFLKRRTADVDLRQMVSRMQGCKGWPGG